MVMYCIWGFDDIGVLLIRNMAIRSLHSDCRDHYQLIAENASSPPPPLPIFVHIHKLPLLTSYGRPSRYQSPVSSRVIPGINARIAAASMVLSNSFLESESRTNQSSRCFHVLRRIILLFAEYRSHLTKRNNQETVIPRKFIIDCNVLSANLRMISSYLCFHIRWAD